MQSLFTAWLAWPVWLIFASLFAFYLAMAAFLVWASFRPPLGARVQTCKGVVAPFFASVGVIFGLLVAFLSNDIWDRNKQAERVVLTESDTLVAQPGGAKDAGIQRTMLDMALKIRSAHEDRVQLGQNRSAVTKWTTVLLLALITQVAIAIVRLERPRPQAAALLIFTVAAVSLLGLLAVHEAPFEPPIFVPPGPIAKVLEQVPL